MKSISISWGRSFRLLPLCFVLICSCISCTKVLQVDQPVNEITSAQVFTSDQLATTAMDGIYANLLNQTPEFGAGFGNGLVTVWCGLSADEMEVFINNPNIVQFQDNQLQSGNSFVNSGFWAPPFNIIYSANAMIQGLATSTGVHDSVINELTGEAEVVRAFTNFYLVNLFGSIPLVTTTNFLKTADLPKSPSGDIYQLIVSDLKDAQHRLPGDYSVGLGQRIVPNRFAAAALLARVYLYMGDYPDAIAEADTVISNTGLYGLVPLNSVFLANSMEAIWQLSPDPNTGVTFNVTPEGYLLIPATNTSNPFVYMTPQLLNAFDSGDQRFSSWLDSTSYGGATYYYPYKYKNGPAQYASGGPVTEFYMMLRLGEQYLIRAEAEANGGGGGIPAAILDMNAIRGRANAPLYVGPTDSTDVLDSIYHERQVELFAEWGHRWLDLKRTGQATNILGQISYKQPWSTDALLYPIPYEELVDDPNLVQNIGY